MTPPEQNPNTARKPAARKTVARKPAEPAARKDNHHWVSKDELQSLREKLREAQETLEAIQSGEVDAVVVNGKEGSHIYTLTSAEEPYRVYVERMQEGAVTLSATGLILYANKKFAEFLEMNLERVIGSDANTYFGSNVWSEIASEIGNSGVVKRETELLRPNETSLPVMITASQLETLEEDVMCLVVTDLSEQKERVKLQLAMEIAERANRSKDSFLAALSHELRTPLTPALMAACLLERDVNLPEKARELATMIRRNVELETRLIDDLLDLTRITQGKIELVTREVDLHEILKESLEICKADLSERNQTIEFSLEATNAMVEGDPVRLQQIFWNLIRNASKFSERNSTIFIESANTRKDRIELRVRDHGVGIDPEVLPTLFSAFEQGGEDVTRRFGGLGLGLSISRSIAELHNGGSIRALSDGKGKGSTFVLSLKVIPKAATTEESPAYLGRILLLEDNADTRLALSELLKTMGYHVTASDSVCKGIEIARSHDFDFMISDVGFGDGTGHELMRTLQQESDIRGIAISGYGMQEDIQRSLDAGFSIHLTKPITLADIEAAIAKVAAP